MDNSTKVMLIFWLISFAIGFINQKGSGLVLSWVGLYILYIIFFGTGLIILINRALSESKGPSWELLENIAYKSLYIGLIIFIPFVLKKVGNFIREKIIDQRQKK